MRESVKAALKSFGVGLLAAMLTGVLLYYWSTLQQSVGTNIPGWLYALTKEIARGCLFISIAPMLMGAVPNMNRWRIGVYFLGTSGFLINLLGDDNAGNVFLEAVLTIQMAWSLIWNWNRHEPMSSDKKLWKETIAVMVFGFTTGLLVTWAWPYMFGSEWEGWWWYWIALAGGITLCIEVNFLETGLLRGDIPLYISFHGFGCGLLTLSYLGMYNAAGVTLNVALFIVVLYSFRKALRERRPPEGPKPRHRRESTLSEEIIVLDRRAG